MIDKNITLSLNPNFQQLKKFKSTIQSSALFSNSTKSQLSLYFSNCSRFYALPKVHEPDIPFRPIVSNIGTASYRLAKFFTTIFSPILSGNTHTVKNSMNFAKIIQTFLSSNLTLVSFNVKSLFTNVPINGTLSFLEKRLKEFHYSAFEITELITLTRTCLSQTTFSFQGYFCKQSEGLVMGSPLSPIIADISMLYFENTLFEKNLFPFLDTLRRRHIYTD